MAHDIIQVTSQMMDLLFICDSCDYDDFVFTAEREKVTKKLNRRKDGVEGKGMKVNMNKTIVTTSGESRK